MDTDLFQILALILLLGLLLTLFGVLQSLGAIRKTLDQRGPGEPAAAPAPQAATTPEPRADEEPETWARPDAAEPVATTTTEDPGWGGASRSGWPAPQEAAPSTVEDQPAASGAPSTGTGARVLYGDSGLTTATPNEAALQPAETIESAHDTTAAASAGAAGSEIAGTMEAGAGGTTGVNASTTDTTAGTAGAGAVTETGRSTDEDPQEQPFERDGRWWFRRGDELLVYEEQSGQWVAADEPSSSGSVAAATATPAETTSAPAETTSAPGEGQVTTQQEAVGSFWKCPSCGAVNGSTATSCRMCFTARP